MTKATKKYSMSKEEFMEFFDKEVNQVIEAWEIENIMIAQSSLEEIKEDYQFDFNFKDVQGYELHYPSASENKEVRKLEIISIEKYFRVVYITFEGEWIAPDTLLTKKEFLKYLKKILKHNEY